MATKMKDGAPVKEKISSSPTTNPKIDNPHGRGSPKPSTRGSGSSDRDHSEKPTPHYLNPTIKSSATSSHVVHKYPKKQASEDGTAKRLTSRKSIDKPPSPSRSQPQKTPLSTNSKEKTLRSPSPSPKPTVSSKPISERTSKINKNAKHQPPTKMKYVNKGTIGDAVNKETRNSTASNTTTSSDTTEEPEVKNEDEEKGMNEHEEEEDTVKIEGDQHNRIEIPMQEDQKLADSINTEPDATDIENTQAPNSSSLNEEHEVMSITKEEEDKKGVDRDEEHEDERSKEVVVAKETSEEAFDEEMGKEENADGKKKQEGDGEVDGDEEAPKPVVENSTVEKQRAAHGKKEAQVFNDVIEETASKLAEKKKNKVLALVGAFETVISLQEPEGQQSQHS